MSKKDPMDMQDLPLEDFATNEDSDQHMDDQLTDSEQDTNQNRIETLMREKGDLQDKYLRLLAEFDNFKKRTARQQTTLLETAAKDTVAALLPVLDDFDRAKALADSDDSVESFSEGVQLVYQKLYAILQQRGLEPMQSTGEPFDPEYHEAVTDIPAPTEDMKGKVIDTIEKGYLLRGNIIRYAKVVVGK